MVFEARQFVRVIVVVACQVDAVAGKVQAPIRRMCTDAVSSDILLIRAEDLFFFFLFLS